MNWDALGALAELAGAAGVIFSVLYLAVQVRAQNRESRMAAAHEIIAAFRSMQVPLQSPNLAELWHKAITDFDSLSDPERMQVFAVVAPMLRVWEEAYLQYHSGHLDKETWEMMVAQFRDLMSAQVFQVLWELRKHVYIKRFAVFVDSIEPNAESFSRLYKTVSGASATPNKTGT